MPDNVHSLEFNEAAKLFEEALAVGMVPIDFRVWRGYCFDLCETPKEALSLCRIYDALHNHLDKHMGEHKISNAERIREFCSDGIVPAFVKKHLLEDADPVLTEYIHTLTSLADKRKPKRFISDGHISGIADTKIQQKWVQQALHCVLANPERPQEWYSKRNSYFTLGVIVWGIVPDPEWLLEDVRVDLYYHLGYAVANKPELQKELATKYHLAFGDHRSWGVSNFSLDEFDPICRNGLYTEYLEGKYRLSETLNKNFNYFFTPGGNKKSIWRLHHMVSISDEKFALPNDKSFLSEFQKPWDEYPMVDFGADRDEKTVRKLLIRKKIFLKALRLCDDPMDLHTAKQQGGFKGIQKFIQDLYREKGNDDEQQWIRQHIRLLTPTGDYDIL